MKKLIAHTLIILLTLSLAACGTSKEPALTVISPHNYDAINEKHMSSLLVGMIISQTWQDANEVEPERFMYYYAAATIKSGKSIFGTWEDGFIPAGELEPMVQSHFNVTTEHLRSGEYYSAEKNAYEFGGLGSTSDCKITNAVRSGKQLTIDYDIIGPMDYKLADGKLIMEFGSEDYLNGEHYTYLSNQFVWSAQRHLCFPSAMDETDQYGVFMMDSGGRSSTSSDGVNRKHYNGEDITSIIAYYENEALPALEAQGSADTTKHDDGWYWSGTYRGGKPLTIDVRRRYGSDSYIITALYDEKSDLDFADGIRSHEFMQPPDLNYFPELHGEYLWKPFKAGVLDTSWDVAENADVPSLVAFYALSLIDIGERETETSFPADDVESYVRRYFDISTDRMRGWNVYDRNKNAYAHTPADRPEVCNIVSATTYGSEDGNPTRIVLAYDVKRSEDDDTVIWSGELTIVLSGGGYKYISNNKYYPQYPITQDTAYLDEVNQRYIWTLAPHTGILTYSWPTPQDIPADFLVDICSANNLLNLPREGGDYIDHHGPAGQVEAAIRQHFDVSAEYLRTSSRYGYVDEYSGEEYPDEYVMLDGGGWGGAVALNTEQDGNLLKITVGLYGPDDEPDRPVKTGLLTIRLNGENYQYLSYELEK